MVNQQSSLHQLMTKSISETIKQSEKCLTGLLEFIPTTKNKGNNKRKKQNKPKQTQKTKKKTKNNEIF